MKVLPNTVDSVHTARARLQGQWISGRSGWHAGKHSLCCFASLACWAEAPHLYRTQIGPQSDSTSRLFLATCFKSTYETTDHFLPSWELCVLPLVPQSFMSLLRQLLLLGKCLYPCSLTLCLLSGKFLCSFMERECPSYLDTAMHSVAFGVFFLQTRVF